MSSDIPQMHFADNSYEAQVIEAVVNRDLVTVEEAIRRAHRTVEVKPRQPSSKRSGKVTEADLDVLRQKVPYFAFMESLPDDVVEGMQAASKQFRAERLVPRG